MNENCKYLLIIFVDCRCGIEKTGSRIVNGEDVSPVCSEHHIPIII